VSRDELLTPSGETPSSRADDRERLWQPSTWRPTGSTGRRVAIVLLTLVVIAVVLGTLLRFLPDTVTPVAQLLSTMPWVAVAAVVALGLALVLRSWALVAWSGAALLVHVVWLAPFFFPGVGLADGVPTLTVLTVNAEYGGADAEQILAAVREHDVDVLSVVELTPRLVASLEAAGIDELLPHSVAASVREGSAAGSGLWSAMPTTQTSDGFGTTFAMPSVTVEVDGTAVRVTAVHPVPPVPGNVDLWAEELGALAAHAHGDMVQQILLGDFNASYDYPTFREVLGGRFADATREAGRGFNFSWPHEGALPTFVDLDHVLVDEDMSVGDVTQVTLDGTDHKALVAVVGIG
jgi:Endonuclease/Exonuclease/phosphatase family